MIVSIAISVRSLDGSPRRERLSRFSRVFSFSVALFAASYQFFNTRKSRERRKVEERGERIFYISFDFYFFFSSLFFFFFLFFCSTTFDEDRLSSHLPA